MKLSTKKKLGRRKKEIKRRKHHINKATSNWLVYDPSSTETVSEKSNYRRPKKFTYKENGKSIRLYEQEKESLDRLQREIQIRNLKSSSLDINKKGG